MVIQQDQPVLFEDAARNIFPTLTSRIKQKLSIGLLRLVQSLGLHPINSRCCQPNIIFLLARRKDSGLA